jgi:hypothetical protein
MQTMKSASELPASDWHDLVQQILTTRDFGGNEAETRREWEADHGVKLSDKERMQIGFRVETEWRRSQLSAGVNFPLSNDERAKAFRDIEEGGR